MNKKLAIVIPVYNDWISLNILLQKIELCLPNENFHNSYSIIIINDASLIEYTKSNKINYDNIHILTLRNNLGHQRAIACGLCFIRENILCDNIIVMDSDGEDNPEDIEKLFKFSILENQIIFAKRAKRQENLLFKIFYKLYKSVFKILTGKVINFGNFSSVPFSFLDKLVYNENLWNNYAATILRANIPYKSLPTIRGKRYDGKSKMTLSALFIHGFSAISVYMDLMAIRIIIFSFSTISISIFMILIVVLIKIFTKQAIPGWASFTTLILLNLLFQALMISFLMLFIFLSKRTAKNIIPINEYKFYLS